MTGRTPEQNARSLVGNLIFFCERVSISPCEFVLSGPDLDPDKTSFRIGVAVQDSQGQGRSLRSKVPPDQAQAILDEIGRQLKALGLVEAAPEKRSRRQ